jgi:hypothetical protein
MIQFLSVSNAGLFKRRRNVIYTANLHNLHRPGANQTDGAATRPLPLIPPLNRFAQFFSS